MTIRVLLADDHAAIRSGLRLMLSSAGDLEVVGEAADGEAALANVRALRPDVVLMDIRMPRLDGIAATARITGDDLAQVIVLTSFEFDDYVLGALRAGAAAFLLKTAGQEQLIDAVRRVHAGEAVLAPEITRTVLARLAPESAPAPRRTAPRGGATSPTASARCSPASPAVTPTPGSPSSW